MTLANHHSQICVYCAVVAFQGKLAGHSDTNTDRNHFSQQHFLLILYTTLQHGLGLSHTHRKSSLTACEVSYFTNEPNCPFDKMNYKLRLIFLGKHR